MGECQILKLGSGFDDSSVTARPENVKAGKKFMGAGDDIAQTGTVPIISKADVKLGINQTYNIQAGYHEGQDRIYQDEIATEEGRVIDPVAGGQTIQVAGKYLTSDTNMQSIENLRPEVIKVGVIIADVVGSYQGFPDEE